MSIITKPIESAINIALAQDAETQVKLEQFDRRSIAIHIKDMDKTILANIKNQRLYIDDNTDQKADLMITASILTLIKLVNQPDSLFSSEVDIHGDVQFARQLRDIFASFDFDWEAQIARLTGDTLAHPIANVIKQGLLWLKDSNHSLQLATAEYLQEESCMLPDKTQINEHMRNVDILCAGIDRLEARINRLLTDSE